MNLRLGRKWSVREGMDSRDPKVQALSYYMEKISRLGMTVYEWSDADIGRLIERYLWYEGKCVIWRSPELGVVITGCSETRWGINGDAVEWRPQFDTDIGGLSRPLLTVDDCVPIYDLPDHAHRRRDCAFLCAQIADVNDTIRTQVSNQKTPMLAYASDRTDANKLKNSLIQIAEGVKALILDSSLRDRLEVLDFKAPYNVESLQQYLWSLESEMLEYLGIDSQDAFQKKERLIVDEQEGNDELLNYMLASGLRTREPAATKANAMFGLSLSVNVQGLVRPLQGMEESAPMDDSEADE